MKPAELENGGNQSKLLLMTSQPIGIARIFLIIPAPSRGEYKIMTSPPPHPQADPLEWGRRVQPRGGAAEGSHEGEGGADISIETLTEDRHGDFALSLMLGITCFTSLARARIFFR